MRNAILKKCPLFADIDEKDLECAFSFFEITEATYEKGEYLNKIGDKLNKFGLVLEGNIQVFADDYYGNQMIMQTVTPGHTFGESLCFLGLEADIYIVATKKTRVLWLKTDRVKTATTEKERFFANRFTTMLARRALSKNNRVQILSKITLRSKLITFFSQYAKRYGNEFTVPFDRNELAVYLGTNRSALSRELSKMKAEGIIDFEKNKFILKQEIH